MLAGLVAAATLPRSTSGQDRKADAVATTTLVLVDPARKRPVPVAIYTAQPVAGQRLKPAILSHGYGAKNTDYAFLAEFLATRGHFVASIQHEIPGDTPLPSTGSPYQTRMPSWRQGMQNILFVVDELKRTHPELDYGHLLLLGHSHGGDTSMLTAQEHPALAQAVISLDNRRMPWPRAAQPRLFSIRSSDQQADGGVIPTPEDQARFGVQIVTLPATRHDDMWDGATAAQKAEMLDHIGQFLQTLR